MKKRLRKKLKKREDQLAARRTQEGALLTEPERLFEFELSRTPKPGPLTGDWDIEKITIEFR